MINYVYYNVIIYNDMNFICNIYFIWYLFCNYLVSFGIILFNIFFILVNCGKLLWFFCVYIVGILFLLFCLNILNNCINCKFDLVMFLVVVFFIIFFVIRIIKDGIFLDVVFKKKIVVIDSNRWKIMC